MKIKILYLLLVLLVVSLLFSVSGAFHKETSCPSTPSTLFIDVSNRRTDYIRYCVNHLQFSESPRDIKEIFEICNNGAITVYPNVTIMDKVEVDK